MNTMLLKESEIKKIISMRDVIEIVDKTFVDLGGGAYRWEIESINPLYEVTVCTFPAYEETGVSARKHQLEDIQRRQAETWRESMKKRIGGN